MIFQKASEEKIDKISKKVAGLGENLTNLIININIFYVFICDFVYLHLKKFYKKIKFRKSFTNYIKISNNFWEIDTNFFLI